MPYSTRSSRSQYDRSRRRPPAHTLKPADVQKAAVERKIFFPVRLPESVVARVRKMVHEALATGRYPWETPAGCIRDLIMRGLETLKDDPLIGDALPYLRLQQQLDSIGTAKREAHNAIGRMKHEIADMIAIGAEREAYQFYYATWETAHAMPPGIWRDWLIEQLEKQFPELHKQLVTERRRVPGVHLGEKRKARVRT